MNPYNWAFKKVEQYGKYAHLFDERDGPAKFEDKSMFDTYEEVLHN